MRGSTAQVLTLVGVAATLAVLARRLWLDRRPGMQQWLRFTRRVEMLFLAALLGAMMVLAVIQIVLRNAAHTGLLWIDPALRYLTLWIGFAGAAFATAEGRHIQIDALARASPPAVRLAARRLVSLVASGVTLILAETAYRHVVDERAFGAVAFLGIPSWVAVSILPVAFALMSYRFLYRACGPSAALAAEAGELPDGAVVDAGGTGASS